jgi:hypothetical protein
VNEGTSASAIVQAKKEALLPVIDQISLDYAAESSLVKMN